RRPRGDVSFATCPGVRCWGHPPAPAALAPLDKGGFMRRLLMNLSACNRRIPVSSRREFLVRSSFGFGSLALGYLMNCDSATASADSSSPVSSLAPRAPDFTAKARNVIFIFLQGGPSQVDTFDPKPELSRLDGQLVPPSFLQGTLGLAQIKAEEAKL